MAEESRLVVPLTRYVLREACARLGGKGGGQPHLAQGSAPVTDLEHVNTVLAGLMANGEL